MAATVTIEKRFCGPPDSGNGGYVGGLLARHYRPDCQVTLLAPPPLDTPLVLAVDAAEARLSRGADTLAVARPFTLELAVPAAPTLEEARAAQCRYAGFVEHSLPTCFVCGPEREPNDGLLIFPGQVDNARVAAPWQPDASLADERGGVLPEFIWAALDCPGYFAVQAQAGLALLGRLAVDIRMAVAPGDQLIVVGWPINHDGRKHLAGTALFKLNGELVACGEATWISLKQG